MTARARGTPRAVEAGAVETRAGLQRAKPGDWPAAEEKMVAAVLDGDTMKTSLDPAADEVRGGR